MDRAAGGSIPGEVLRRQLASLGASAEDEAQSQALCGPMCAAADPTHAANYPGRRALLSSTALLRTERGRYR